MSTTAYYRNTPVEIRSFTQEANHVTLECSSRTLPPVHVGNGQVRAVRLPPLDIHESELTPEQHAKMIEVFTFLEEAYWRKYEQWAAAPERNVELVNAAVLAEQRLAAMAAEEQRLDKELARKRAELAELSEKTRGAST